MKEKIRFFPIDVMYKVIDDKPVIHLFGKTSDNKQICVLYGDFEPYFYVIPKTNSDIIKKLKTSKIIKNDESVSITSTEAVKRIYLGKEVNAIKVFTKLPRHVPVIREELKNWKEIESINEDDILFVRRFLIDKNIIPMTLYEVEGKFINQKLKVPAFTAEKIEQFSTETLLEPKILSIDIETYSQHRKDLQTFPGGAKKGDWDIGIAMDTIELSNKLDVIILVSGDGDYVDLLQHLRRAMGVKCEVMAFGPSSSAKLIEEADEFYDMDKHKVKFLMKY